MLESLEARDTDYEVIRYMGTAQANGVQLSRIHYRLFRLDPIYERVAAFLKVLYPPDEYEVVLSQVNCFVSHERTGTSVHTDNPRCLRGKLGYTAFRLVIPFGAATASRTVTYLSHGGRVGGVSLAIKYTGDCGYLISAEASGVTHLADATLRRAIGTVIKHQVAAVPVGGEPDIACIADFYVAEIAERG